MHCFYKLADLVRPLFQLPINLPSKFKYKYNLATKNSSTGGGRKSVVDIYLKPPLLEWYFVTAGVIFSRAPISICDVCLDVFPVRFL